jgi:methanogenic corrinoid protein MtbC1
MVVKPMVGLDSTTVTADHIDTAFPACGGAVAYASFQAAMPTGERPRQQRGAESIGPGRAEVSPRQRLALLARTIEREIVPRLVLARRAEAEAASDSAAVPGEAEVAALAALLLANDLARASAYVAAERARGVGIERLYLDLLAPTARRLGDLWSEDLCDFTAVTLGLWRLEQVLREYGPAFAGEPLRRDASRRALLTTVPGEQHGFGILMVAEFFRRAGWEVETGPFQTLADLAAMARSEWFAIAGFSVAVDGKLDQLAAAIRAARRASRNPSIGIMVGGRLFTEKPELVALVGADATAVDGRQAALQAEHLRALLAARA